MKSWRQKLSLTIVLTLLAVATIVAVSTSIGVNALQVVYENKLRDTWTIMFLNLERSAHGLRANLEEIAKANPQAEAQLTIGPGGRIMSGPAGFKNAKTLRDLGLAPERQAPVTIASYGGKTYLAVFSAGRVSLSPIDLPGLLKRAKDAQTATTVYVSTRLGTLVYSNDVALDSVAFQSRALVQRFVATPFRQGQLEFRNENGDQTLGFFREIPDTNLVLFSETPKTFAFGEVRRVVMKFAAFAGIVVAVAILLLQLPLAAVTSPLRSVIRTAEQIGQGNFELRTAVAGLGEVNALTRAFDTMAQNLSTRDREIKRLMAEQTEKVRLQAELNIARGIQDNFLPRHKIPRESGFDIAVNYVPATEVAGDWYGLHHDEASGETIVVIADVSGHGAGAAMFTAVISGLFEDLRLHSTGPFPCKTFIEKTNAVLHRLGKRQWHASVLLTRLMKGERKAEIFAAGHCPPLLASKGEAKSIRINSALAGLDETIKPTQSTIEIEPGAVFLIYTDGLVEARDASGRRFGTKRLVRALVEQKGTSESTIGGVLAAWRDFVGQRPAEDDVCVLVVRSV